MSPLHLGIDIGSVTVKLVVVDDGRRLLEHRYLRSCGRPRTVLADALRALDARYPLDAFQTAGLSGSGGGPVAEIIGGRHVNELVAQARAIELLHPEARTVVEIGGQDSKLLSLRHDERTGRLVLADFAMNALCAAGTGAFLDQQAERLGISIEGEWESLAMRSTRPAKIAGRCTVFAKSDMIHLQQRAVPLEDILMGVCLALARNFRTVIGKGRAFTPPVVFQGGVAGNAAVVRAFEEVLGLEAGRIIVPEHHRLMPALGTAFLGMENSGPVFRGRSSLDALDNAASEERARRRSLPVLRPSRHAPSHGVTAFTVNGSPLPVWLGVDIGSISTKAVLVDAKNRLIARWYGSSEGRPLDAVRDALRSVGDDVGVRVAVMGAGATGSGRHLTGDFIGADVVRNEITAQARAAVAVDPEVDTIIEIGGQDSKFMRLDHGAVVDFAMNNACAAGTGSFLEEQADRLGIDIATEFAASAFSSTCPAGLGERCTVFMESDLVHHQQQGSRVQDLTAGLAYSIADNYLNRVANGRPIGRRVFFQGAVASNAAVVSAFAQRTNRDVVVPRNNDVTGAIGAAILAREVMQARATRSGNAPERTRFRGFDLSERTYESNVFECRACPNLCEVNRVTMGAEPPIFYGARCDRFEDAGRKSAGDQTLPDPFADRERLLLEGWHEPGKRNGKPRVGIARNLLYFDMFPFWRAFFDTLGYEIVLSEPTNTRLVGLTRDNAGLESCFPVKLAFGHHADLLAQDLDFLFAPCVMNRETGAPGQPHTHVCPMVTAVPQLLRANMPAPAGGPNVLTPTLHLQNSTATRKQLRALARQLGSSSRAGDRAAASAHAAQREFHAKRLERGRELVHSLHRDNVAAVVVGRGYNTNDLGANLDLPLKLRKLGVLPLPIDFLPLDDAPMPEAHVDMFWRTGQDILRAAHVIREHPHLHAVYLTNFNCGPDAFLLSFFREAMGSKPFLELEVDEHTGDAGLVTRCEAFFDSLGVGLMESA